MIVAGSPSCVLSTFTYYGSLESKKLIKILFWAQIGSSQALEEGWCDFDSFCSAYSHGKLFATTVTSALLSSSPVRLPHVESEVLQTTNRL